MGGAGAAACPMDCLVTMSCSICTTYSGPPSSCTVDNPVDVYDPVEGVQLDCRAVAYDAADGYTVAEGGTVLLHGEACEALQADRPHRIEVLLGCNLDR